jgi:O-antigen ligase
MSAKEIVFAIFFLGGSAGLAGAVIALPALRRVYLSLFFIGVIKVVDINFVSREAYRGWVRGFEIGSLDMLALGLLAAVLMGNGKHRVQWVPAGFLPMALYVGIAALSVAAAYVPQYAAFGLLKFVRDLLVFWIVANAIRDEDDLKWLIWTGVVVITFESLISVKDYFGGVYRARGTFSHSNTLGMYLNMWLPIIFSYLLNVKDRFQALFLGVFGMGCGVVVLTLSRGSWVTMFMAVAMVVPLSLFVALKPRKFALLGLMAILAMPPGVIAVQKMITRIREAPEASGEARHTFNDTAADMARDLPLGVGINNYSYGTDASPYSEEYQGGLDQGGLCHNVYYLTLGEMGWVGLISFLFVLASMYTILARFFITSFRDDLRTVWAIGWLAGLSTVVLQSWLEWALRQTVLSFTFYGLAAVMVGVARMKTGPKVTRWSIRTRMVTAAPQRGSTLRGHRLLPATGGSHDL